jgi:hypothetical protein
MQAMIEQDPTEPGFVTPEGLRAVLTRLHNAGPGAWNTDREARELVVFAGRKYRRLAATWHRDEADAMHAAFVAMTATTTRRADDPWAVVTTAVARTLKAETRADRHMISTDRARHPGKLVDDPPIRAGEHEEFVFDILHTPTGDPQTVGEVELPQIVEAARFLTLLGWPAEVATATVDYVTDRLAAAGNRDTAFESLRRDASIPALLDIPRSSWTRLVRVLLGSTTSAGVPARRGILARVLLGETAATLLIDDALVLATAAPTSATVTESTAGWCAA